MRMRRYFSVRFLSALLIVALGLQPLYPAIAFALRQVNAGAEDSPARTQLEQSLAGMEQHQPQPREELARAKASLSGGFYYVAAGKDTLPFDLELPSLPKIENVIYLDLNYGIHGKDSPITYKDLLIRSLRGRPELSVEELGSDRFKIRNVKKKREWTLHIVTANALTTDVRPVTAVPKISYIYINRPGQDGELAYRPAFWLQMLSQLEVGGVIKVFNSPDPLGPFDEQSEALLGLRRVYSGMDRYYIKVREIDPAKAKSILWLNRLWSPGTASGLLRGMEISEIKLLRDQTFTDSLWTPIEDDPGTQQILELPNKEAIIARVIHATDPYLVGKPEEASLEQKDLLRLAASAGLEDFASKIDPWLAENRKLLETALGAAGSAPSFADIFGKLFDSEGRAPHGREFQSFINGPGLFHLHWNLPMLQDVGSMVELSPEGKIQRVYFDAIHPDVMEGVDPWPSRTIQIGSTMIPLTAKEIEQLVPGAIRALDEKLMEIIGRDWKQQVLLPEDPLTYVTVEPLLENYAYPDAAWAQEGGVLREDPRGELGTYVVPFTTTGNWRRIVSNRQDQELFYDRPGDVEEYLRNLQTQLANQMYGRGLVLIQDDQGTPLVWWEQGFVVKRVGYSFDAHHELLQEAIRRAVDVSQQAHTLFVKKDLEVLPKAAVGMEEISIGLVSSISAEEVDEITRQVLDLYNIFFEETGDKNSPLAMLARGETYNRLYNIVHGQDPTGILHLARSTSGQVVGYALTNIHDLPNDTGRYMNISQVVVLPDHRDQGIAAGLVEAAVQEIDRGRPPLWVESVDASKGGATGKILARLGFSNVTEKYYLKMNQMSAHFFARMQGDAGLVVISSDDLRNHPDLARIVEDFRTTKMGENIILLEENTSDTALRDIIANAISRNCFSIEVYSDLTPASVTQRFRDIAAPYPVDTVYRGFDELEIIVQNMLSALGVLEEFRTPEWVEQYLAQVGLEQAA